MLWCCKACPFFFLRCTLHTAHRMSRALFALLITYHEHTTCTLYTGCRTHPLHCASECTSACTSAYLQVSVVYTHWLALRREGVVARQLPLQPPPLPQCPTNALSNERFRSDCNFFVAEFRYRIYRPPPPLPHPCISYGFVQATADVGTVFIWARICFGTNI